MNFKRKINKALALLLSLSLAMSTNVPVSAFANEAATPERESTAAEIAYVKSGEEVIGIDLSANPVVIEEAKDVSGNTVAGCFNVIYDANRNGVADAGEEKLAIEGETAFASTLKVYGIYNEDTDKNILITMNSGTVAELYGAYYGEVQSTGDSVSVVINGGNITFLQGFYGYDDGVYGRVYVKIGEQAVVESFVASNSYDHFPYYVDNQGAIEIYGDYTMTANEEYSSLRITDGIFVVPKGLTLTADEIYLDGSYGYGTILLRGTLDAANVTAGYSSRVFVDGGTLPENCAINKIFYPFSLKCNLDGSPMRPGYSSDYFDYTEDGKTTRFLIAGQNTYFGYAAIEGYDCYYSTDGVDYKDASSTFYLQTPQTGSMSLELLYVPKQISVENKYSAPKGVVGQTYTAEKPLCDLSVYPITNDTTEEYGGEVKYAVKKTTPLPEGLSLVKGKIVGTPTKACEEGQKVTFAVTGRNGSTTNFDLTIKIKDSGEEKGINELIQPDVENKKIDLNGTSIVILPNAQSSYYSEIYLDMDHDKLPDNNEPLVIGENTRHDLYSYEIIGYSNAEKAYDGDISITLKSGKLKKLYGIYGTENAPVSVNGDVNIYLEGISVSNCVFGSCYGKADNVTVSYTSGWSDNVDICAAYESEITGDVNLVFAEKAVMRGAVESDYAVLGVADSSVIGGNVNVKGGSETTDYGFMKHGIRNYWTRFTGVSDTEVGGSIIYDIAGVWIPAENSMVSNCTVEKDVVFCMATDHLSTTSPLVTDTTVAGDLKLVSDEETGYKYYSGSTVVIDGTSAVEGDLFIDIKKGGFNGNWEPVGANVSLEKGVYINNCGLISIGTASGEEYVITEDVNARSLTVLEGANVKIAEGVSVTLSGSLNIESGAKLINNGTVTMSSAGGTITGTLENNGTLTTTATKNNGLTIADTGLVLNGETGVWNVACYLANSGKIVNYGSFVQTYSYWTTSGVYYYAKLGKVYTTKSLTLSGDPTTSAPYTTTDYQDGTRYHSQLYYAITVDYPTQCAAAPALTGTEIAQSGISGDANKYIRVYRTGNGTSEFTVTPGTPTSENFALESVVYGSGATQIEGTDTFTASVVNMFEPITITMNYVSNGDVPSITLEKSSDTVTGLAVDQVYTYEQPLYDLTNIAIAGDITAEDGKVMYFVREGNLPDGIQLKDGKLYGRLTTATAEQVEVDFDVQGLNLTKSGFTLTFDPIAKAVPQWEIPGALTATVGQTLEEVEVPIDARGEYKWPAYKDLSQTFTETGTVTERMYFQPNDIANYDWSAISGWDDYEDNIVNFDIDIVVEPTDIEVTAPTGLTAVYGQTFAEVEIPSDENGSFEWDTEHHAPTDFVGETGEHTCYVTYIPTSKNYKEKTGIEVTLTVNAATPDYNESLKEVELLCDETLGDVLLPDADGGRYQWVSSTSTEPVEGESYQMIYIPEDTTNYDWTTVTGWNKMRKGVVFSVAVKLEHAWGEGVVTKPATEKEEGVKTYECGLCDATRTEVIPKLPNSGESDGGESPEPSTPPTGPSAPAEPPIPQPPKVGYAISDSSSKAVYKVSKQGKEVTFVKPNKKTYTKVTIPATVTYEGVKYKVTAIANNACKSNSKLKTVKIGSNVKTIGSKAFYGCKKLTKVTIGSKVTTIGNSAFQNCTVLKSITIPSKVSKIGSKAFYGCKKLLKMTIKTTKLTQKKVGKNAFTKMGSSNYKKVVVKVPKKQKKAYTKWLKKCGLNKKAKIK